MAWTEPPRTWTDVTDTPSASIMNQHIRDQFNATWHLCGRLVSDISITNNATTFVNVTGVSQVVGANEVWQFLLFLRIDGGGAGGGDLDVSWSFPTGGVAESAFTGNDSTGASRVYWFRATASDTQVVDIEASNTTNGRIISYPMMYTNGSTSGTVQLRFKQKTSHSTATTLKVGTCLLGMKVV